MLPEGAPGVTGSAWEDLDGEGKASPVIIGGKYKFYRYSVYSKYTINFDVLNQVNVDDLSQFLYEAHELEENLQFSQKDRDSMKDLVQLFLYRNSSPVYNDIMEIFGKDGIPEWLWKDLYQSSWALQGSVLCDIPTVLFEKLLTEGFWEKFPPMFHDLIQLVQQREDLWGELPRTVLEELLSSSRSMA